MADPVRLGLIGAGAISQSHVNALKDCTFGHIAAVADVRLDAAQAAAESLHCQAFDSYEALADSGTCDAVIVCTPPARHAEIAIYCLNRDIHVLCEKPLSTDIASARAMKQAAERNGVIMTMASKFRYVEDVIRAKSILTSGILGDVILIENAFTGRVDMSKRWNSDPAVSGGGVLMDNGTHSVDVIRYLSGPIASVLAVEARRVQHKGVEDTASIFVRTTSGIAARVDLSWSLNKETEDFVTIYGTHGTVRVGWHQSKYRQHAGSDWIVFGNGYDKIAAFRRQAENFCNAIRGTEPLLITSCDAVASVEVIEAVYASLRDGRWTDVESRPMEKAGLDRPEAAE